MKSKHLIAIFIVAALAIVVASTLQISSTSENYTKELEASREEKNKMFKNSKESPLTSSQKDHFTSLTYFPIDPDYNIRADFNPISEKSYITIPYSDGSSERYLKFGYAEFVLNEQNSEYLY